MPGHPERVATTEYDAIVVGSGPNGLVAAATLAGEGLSVLVLEAEDTLGGGARSAELTLPGFVHDTCSTVWALGLASKAMRELPLEEHGVEWIQPDLPVANPLDGVPAALLHRSVDMTAEGLGVDANAYRRLMGPLVGAGFSLVDGLLSPFQLPRHPLKLARYGISGIRSARGLGRSRFETEEAAALLGGLAAHYYSQLQHVRVSYREGLSGGDDIEVDKKDAIADFEPEHTQLYRGWFDLGKHVSFEGGYWNAVYRDTKEITTGFTFGRESFFAGERVSTRVEMTTADLDLVLKPLNNRWVELGLHLGSRYMIWETQFKGEDDSEETSRLEAAVPVVGASFAFRPTRFMELFAKGRIGYLDYDRPRSSRYDDGDIRTVEAKEKKSKSIEIDVGVKFLFFDTVGLIAGYRLDHLQLEREVDNRTEGVKGTAHGVYAGLILDF